MTDRQARARILVWSDYVCPYCYFLERELDRIRERHSENVIIEYYAFELRPEPVPTLEPQGKYLLTTWSRSVYPMGKDYGMPIRLPSVQPRSSLAFQMSEYARAVNSHDKVHLALFHAFFVEDRNIGDLSVLLEIGGNLGLDVAELAHHLRTGTYKAEIDQQRRKGLERQVTGVPALFLEPVDPGAFPAKGAVGGNTNWLERNLMQVAQ